MTKDQLHTILPAALPERIELFLPYLNKYMPAYGITGRLREAAFIAQVAHESGSLKYTRELANGDAYEGREDLGNSHKGDGRRFKGRGLIQITGRANYTTLSKAFKVDFINKPELLESPAYAIQSACWFWKMKGLNELADKMNDMNKAEHAVIFEAITRKINGGVNGLVDRKLFFTRACKVL